MGDLVQDAREWYARVDSTLTSQWHRGYVHDGLNYTAQLCDEVERLQEDCTRMATEKAELLVAAKDIVRYYDGDEFAEDLADAVRKAEGVDQREEDERDG